jgi:glycosyltransferase involved in cell wall biosynthesis
MGVVKRGFATRMAERLEIETYRRAAAVTGQSDEIIASIRSRCPGVTAQVVTNGVDPDRFGRHHADNEARGLLGDEPGPIFIFAGLLGLAQGLDQILDLAKSLTDDIPGRFVLVGDGPARTHLERRIEAESIARVRILPAQNRERIPSLLAAADVALVSLGMTIPGAVPSKIYEAMASSLPILLIADGEPARRIKQAGCGLAVRPGDRFGLLTTFRILANDQELRTDLGLRGRRASETVYNRDNIAALLHRLLHTLLASRDSDYRVRHRRLDAIDSSTRTT